MVEYHSYWEHYGAKPTVKEFADKLAAEAAANEYNNFNKYEDGYHADLYTKKIVVYTAEDKIKQAHRREATKIHSFNLREQFDFGIAYLENGQKTMYYMDGYGHFFIKINHRWNPCCNTTFIDHFKSAKQDWLKDLFNI